jgi:phenylacetate-CoA ligase
LKTTQPEVLSKKRRRMENVGGKKYLDEKSECMPREALQRLQLERFKDLLRRARKNCAFYRDFIEEHGAQNVQIKSLDDIQKIPLMSKKESRQAYPDKLVIVGKEKLKQVHGTSGKTGKRTLTFTTERDLELWAQRSARNFWGIGFRPGDRIQSGGYGFASGGFGYQCGAQHMGICVIPMGVGKAAQKIEMIDDLRVKGIGGGPSFLAYMGQVALESGMNFPEKPYPKLALFGGEPTPKSTRDKIESLFGVRAYDEYGMTELLGPGMAAECEMREGLHAWTDHVFVECIDPKTGERVPDGEFGELVWTFLVSEAMAIIRYRSGDLSRIISEPCACGRSHVRIANITGRVDDGVSIGGWTVWPSQVEDVLFRFKEAGSNFQCIVDYDERGLDRLVINLEVSDSSFLHDEKNRDSFIQRLRDNIKSVLGVTPKGINLVEPDTLPKATDEQLKTSGIRIIDKRKKY